MPQFDASANLFGLPLWAAAALAGLIVILVAIAVTRSGWSQTSSLVTQLGVVLVAGLFGLSLIDRMVASDSAAERRAFEQRLADLDRSVQAAGSPVACLDGLSGEVVGDACEKALFASPQSVAAAISYVATRLDLLRDGARLERETSADVDEAVADLRRFAENDRFGFVAQVLAARDGCSADACGMFKLLQSSERVIANFKERTFEVLVGRHVSAWQSQPSGPALASAPKDAGGSDQTVNIDFPTAASIPPVSIMNNEPGMPGQNGMSPSPAVAPAPGLAPNSPAAAEASAAAAPPRARAAPTPTPRPARRPPPGPAAPTAPATATAAPQQITPQ